MADKFPIRWTVEARDDLLALVDRIVSENPPSAKDFLRQLQKMTGHLSDFPKIGHEMESVLAVRQLLVSPARLMYLRDENSITIIACTHQNRDWQTLLENRLNRQE